MIKLMKYELRKTMTIKLMILGATALAEIVFLIGLFANKNRMAAIGVGLLAMLAFGGVMIIGVASVVILHRDMNTKQSYMLFMTPNSCYKILGAKVLENGLSIALTGAFYFALGALDISLLFAKQGQLNQIWQMMQDMIKSINEEIPLNADALAAFTFSLLAGWIATVVTAYLADVISAALLNGKSFNGVISFVIFLGLNWAFSWLEGIAIQNIPNVVTTMLVRGGLSLVVAAVMYVATAQIMEKKLSV